MTSQVICSQIVVDSCPRSTSLATCFSFSAYINTCFFTSTISGAPLGIDDLKTILNDTFRCRAKWYNLGIQLQVDVSTLDCIKVQYDDPGDQLREVVKVWLTSIENPTWGGMIEALKSPVIDDTLLARELQQKYCFSCQTPVDGE